MLLDKLIIAITTTHDQAIQNIGQLGLVEASLVMIIPVPQNTHKAGVHGRQNACLLIRVFKAFFHAFIMGSENRIILWNRLFV